RVSVVACGPVGLETRYTGASRRVTVRYRAMTLLGGGIDVAADGKSDAGAGLAPVENGAGVPVGARRAVGLRGVRALTARGVAAAANLARTRELAEHRTEPGTDSTLAHVRRRACRAVVACRPVRLRRVRAQSGRGIARAGVMALVGRADRLAQSQAGS